MLDLLASQFPKSGQHDSSNLDVGQKSARNALDSRRRATIRAVSAIISLEIINSGYGVCLPMEQLAKPGFASSLPLACPAADKRIATLFRRVDTL
jgi:hypothetical protein